MWSRIKHYTKWKFVTGHINIRGLMVYGRNAMHWRVQLHTKKYGYIRFRLPLLCDGHWRLLYFYCSPNATSWAATFMIGKKYDCDDWAKSRVRRLYLGYNFDVHGWNKEYECENYDILRGINRSLATGCWYHQK